MRGWGNRLSKINGITVFPLDPEFMPSSYKNKNPRELAKKIITLLLAPKQRNF